MTYTREFATFVVAVTFVIGAVLLPNCAQGQCNAATIEGSYGFRFTSLLAPPGAGKAVLPISSFVPAAQAGRIVFTPNSSTSADGTAEWQQAGNIGGVPTAPTFSGTYSIHPDCTGTLTRSSNGPEAFLVVVQSGAEIEFAFHDSPGGQIVGEGVMKKQ